MASDAIKVDELLHARRGDPAVGIGGAARRPPRARGIKVSALARQVGVSPSLISQIERGQSRPSVSTLFALAEALDVPVDAFFRDGDQSPAAPEPQRLSVVGEARSPDREQRHLVRRGDALGDRHRGRRALGAADAGPARRPRVPGARLRAPAPSRTRRSTATPAWRWCWCSAGGWSIFVGFERYELEPGDSICFPSSTPHRYVNPTEETTRAVTVILPDGEMHGPPTNKRRP